MERRTPRIHKVIEKAKSFIHRPHSQPREVREVALHAAQSAIEKARIGLIDPISDEKKRRKEAHEFRATSFGYAHSHPSANGIQKDVLKKISKGYGSGDLK